MAIGSVVEKSGSVYIYDERGRYISQVPSSDGLQGYTGSTVSVRRGAFIYVYDERGRYVSQVPAR